MDLDLKMEVSINQLKLESVGEHQQVKIDQGGV